MKKQPFFSIIMPVYGVEIYLSTAIDSILSQTFEDFELILVDDKSPDNCPKICDDYAKKDNRIKVIHKTENQGLGMARNTGMENASGEYLFFVDSDDTLECATLEVVNNSLGNGTEILVFGIKRVYENKNGEITHIEELSCEEYEGCTLKESGDIFLKLTDAHIFPYAWNKVYKKGFIINNAATFERTKLIEDFLFNIFLFSKAEKIKVISDCFYNYRKPAHQTLANTYSPEFYDLVKRKFELESEFLKITGNNYFDARQTVLYSHIKHIISVFIRNKAKSAKLSVKNQKIIMKNVLSDETTISVLNEYVPKGIVNKIICFLFTKKMINACYLMIMCVNFLKKR